MSGQEEEEEEEEKERIRTQRRVCILSTSLAKKPPGETTVVARQPIV